MENTILKRTGLVLLLLGLAEGAAWMFWPMPGEPGIPGVYVRCAALGAIGAGIALLWAPAATARWVGGLAELGLAGAIVAAVAPLVMVPFDLTLTALRLDPAPAIRGAATLLPLVAVLLWTRGEPRRSAFAESGTPPWHAGFPTQAGAGSMLVATAVAWLNIHGQSAQLAQQLALEQMGPGYRYALTSLSSAGNGRGKTVSGVVTAWNHGDIQKVILHWDER
jgi:hypothetical protein